ncbi:hypothetical protein [Halocynthiibacter sp.]|uniref:hypothetical protein n=1 Tax=Halocynthiibacter sp. TaxID=1979210 RepID=UPI003C609075
MKFFLPTAFMTILLQTATPTQAQQMSMFDGFQTYCIEQVLQDTPVPRTGLYRFTDDEVKQLAQNLNFSEIPQAIWVPFDGKWIITDMDMSEHRYCSVLELSKPLDHNVSDWNAQVFANSRYRGRGEASVTARRAGGWVTTPVEDGFVQLSLSNFEVSADPFMSMSMLTAIRVGDTPASCEYFPEECQE